MNAVEAQDVGSERAQTRKDAGIAADAAGNHGSVTDVVGAILEVPVATDGFGTLSGWQHDIANRPVLRCRTARRWRDVGRAGWL
jgi:hypothetical protein